MGGGGWGGGSKRWFEFEAGVFNLTGNKQVVVTKAQQKKISAKDRML